MAPPPPPRSRPARTPRQVDRLGAQGHLPAGQLTQDSANLRHTRYFDTSADIAGDRLSTAQLPPDPTPGRAPLLTSPSPLPLQRQRHRASRRRHNPRWPRDRAKPALPPPLPTRARDHPAPCNRDYDCTRPGTLVTTSAGSTPARVELALPSTLPARQRARHPRHNISRLHARSGRARAPVYNDCTKPGTLVTTSPGSTPARAEPALPSTLPARQCACTLPVRPRPRPHRRLHGSPAQPIASHEAPPPFPPSRHSRPPAGPRSRPSISPNLISARPAAEAHPLPSPPPPPPPPGAGRGPPQHCNISREHTSTANCAHPAPAGISALNRAPSTTPCFRPLRPGITRSG